MDMNWYQIASSRTMPNDFDDLAVCNYSMGLAGEAGEVTDLLKKYIHHGHDMDHDKLKKELGDVLHYLAGIALAFNIELEDVATANIEKLRKRYPNGFSQEASIKRVDVHE